MAYSFAHYEPDCKPRVRTNGNDILRTVSHNRNMARRGIPKDGASWFIREWMDYLGVRQRDMIERCGWSKASASQIYTGKQDFNPKIVGEAAAALNVETFELLMAPERAMAQRRLRAEAENIVKLVPAPTEPEVARKKAESKRA